MCCARCEDQVRGALFALGGVRDVLCDPRNQRVTVTGSVDPAQALKQVRRVKNGATFWSDASTYSAHRYEVSSHQKSYRVLHQDSRDRRSYVQSDTREQRSHTGQYNRSSSDAYTRSFCPAYRDTAKTYYVSLNPTIATVEERECWDLLQILYRLFRIGCALEPYEVVYSNKFWPEITFIEIFYSPKGEYDCWIVSRTLEECAISIK